VKLVAGVGFEPTTFGLWDNRYTKFRHFWTIWWFLSIWFLTTSLAGCPLQFTPKAQQSTTDSHKTPAISWCPNLTFWGPFWNRTPG